ncbi:sensor histidine kinase [Starkeya koreensis]|uniref:histidine kinase n=1 Tax=Ancylobacter koreensis TaxID=266121 RepID=A0ABT0DJW2_9HYPH|nr:sensor histidine kinase [Ancylobacter koreensis]MCK0207570.1 sensor histidine kinase [Ancylobacter koreensis]
MRRVCLPSIAGLLPALCLALAVLCACGSPAAARTVANDWFEVDTELAVLRDPAGTLTLDDVLARGNQFQHIASNGINIGTSSDVVWLRVEAKAYATRAGALALSPATFDIVDAYVAQLRPGLRAQDFHSFALGDHRPLPAVVATLYGELPLDLRDGETTLVYLRLVSLNTSLNLSLDLYPAAQAAQRAVLMGLGYGFWFGGMAILVLIQFVFFHFERKAYYLLLAASSVTTILVYCANLGVARLLWFPGGGNGHDLFHMTAYWLGVTFWSLTTASVLDLRRRTPWLGRLFDIAAVLGILGGLAALLGYNRMVIPAGNILIAAFSTVAAARAVFCAREQGLGSSLRAIAYVLFWLGLVATVVQRMGLFPLPNWVTHSYGIGVLLYTLLLTGGLGARLRLAEVQNRQMAEAALALSREAEDRANALVAQRTDELVAARRTAEEALEAELEARRREVRFMEVLSHQYRTPLASIGSNIDTIALSLPPSDTANADRIRRVRRAVARLVELLRFHISRSRLEGAAFRPALAPVPAGTVVETAVGRARDLAQSAGIELEVAEGAGAVRVSADAELLVAALMNLIDNAVKFAGPGNGPVRVRCFLDTGGHVVLEVADTGIGIPPDEIERVRERGYRASNAADIEGTGLGLSLVQRIADAHGAVFDIVSNEAEGTRLSLRLTPLG